MNPEQARALRNQIKPRPMGAVRRSNVLRSRLLHFDAKYPEQLTLAKTLLEGIEQLRVQTGPRPDTLRIDYFVSDFTLQGIEAALMSQGFHFANGPLRRICRLMIYFGEETELRNLSFPERLIKQSNKVYSNAWDHHMHGDHDATPHDLREQK